MSGAVGEIVGAVLGVGSFIAGMLTRDASEARRHAREVARLEAEYRSAVRNAGGAS